jgi:hypothetical protein
MDEPGEAIDWLLRIDDLVTERENRANGGK